jgi:epoxyqueuosine reductase
MTQTLAPISAGEVKTWARDLGFDEVRIAAAEPIPEAERFFEDWVRRGFHGGMKYLEDFRARLARLKKEIPDAKSIIVVGANYYQQPRRAKNAAGLEGRVALYAWGRDYHRALKERLARLADFLRARNPNARCVPCVDTQPVFERSVAERAGMGFRGRHTNLLNRRYGPWLFLAELITNLELSPDGPEDHGDCGTCRICLDICPTQAIVNSHEIDARRCIAYLTIEHRGAIPREIRPLMKDWVFGCDECLAKCPFTRASQETKWPEFRTDPIDRLDLLALFSIGSNRRHEERFRGTALLRASRKMILRNAAVVLGNLGDARAVPVLAKALEKEGPLVRMHAAWALGRIGTGGARRVLEERLREESNPEVREEIRLALSGSASTRPR